MRIREEFVDLDYRILTVLADGVTVTVFVLVLLAAQVCVTVSVTVVGVGVTRTLRSSRFSRKPSGGAAALRVTALQAKMVRVV